MGIDGIGKPPPIGPSGPAVGSTPAAREFQVGSTAEARPAGELGRLERGEIGLDAYLDIKVEDATRHLAGKLLPDQLDFVRQTLRSELQDDPVLVELIRRTTGKTPETQPE
jgi:hypothetical protein